MMNFLVTLGLLLLFFPPFFTSLSQNLLKKYPVLIGFLFNLFIGAVLTGLLIGLVPQATSVFVFYYILFFVTRLFIRSSSAMRISQLDAFTLSVYLCFAVSVLWEIPIQLSVYQNIDAVIISGFKALAIPLFFHKIYSLGWRFKELNEFALSLVISACLLLALFISDLGINNMFWYAHLFRIPIILYLYSLIINITHIKGKIKQQSYSTDVIV